MTRGSVARGSVTRGKPERGIVPRGRSMLFAPSRGERGALRRLQRALSGAIGSAALWSALGCSWDRFDQLRENPPVEVLNAPTTVPLGFGSVLAVITAGDDTSVLVGGMPGTSGAGVFVLGQREMPETDAADSAHCQRGNAARTCALAKQPVGFRRVFGGVDRESCYISGPGQKDDDAGLFGRCRTGEEFVVPVPADIEADVIAPLLMGRAAPLVSLAASREAEPVMLAAVEDSGRAFYYEQDSLDPVDLAVASPPDSFGQAVAVARLSSGWLLAVAAPDAGELHLFLTTGAGALPVGCLEGRSAFGRTLAAGDFDGDGEEDLAVAAEDDVSIFSGAELGALAPTDGSCTLATPQADLVLVTVSCEEGPGATDCEGSRFGASIQIDDFDGDGQGEVAVGAPDLTVSDLEGAGAVQVFDGDGDLIDLRVLSDAHAGGRFGEVMVSVTQGDRSILVVGEPGAEAASVVYCTAVAGMDASDRCR